MTAPQTIFTADPNARFRSTVHRLTGINLSDSKVPMIVQRLRRRVLEWGQPSTDDYLTDLLAGRLGDGEMDLVIDLVTTNTTSFFREKVHFDTLSEILIPQLLADTPSRPARLKLWSAASSEGAEAYSLAMVMAEAQHNGQPFDWAILGTDISRSMVAKARKAIYDADQVDPVDPVLRQRYVMTSLDPATRHMVRIVPELRNKTRFLRMNLMDPVYPVDRDIDVIFLRNVLIYFNAQDRAKVVRHLHSHLRKGGYLIVGHSEGMSVPSDGFVRVRPTIYRKV
jgi:chemotaxis protein methyltransferase CheR